MFTSIVAVLLSIVVQASAGVAANETRVRVFVKAFNDRNIDGMLESADDDIQWLSVSGERIAVETQSKAALKTSMESYFKSCPSCRSELLWVQSTGNRLAAHEKAMFTKRAGVATSQSGLSVYEFKDGRILRVYYFPVER